MLITSLSELPWNSNGFSSLWERVSVSSVCFLSWRQCCSLCSGVQCFQCSFALMALTLFPVSCVQCLFAVMALTLFPVSGVQRFRCLFAVMTLTLFPVSGVQRFQCLFAVMAPTLVLVSCVQCFQCILLSWHWNCSLCQVYSVFGVCLLSWHWHCSLCQVSSVFSVCLLWWHHQCSPNNLCVQACKSGQCTLVRCYVGLLHKDQSLLISLNITVRQNIMHKMKVSLNERGIFIHNSLPCKGTECCFALI